MSRSPLAPKIIGAAIFVVIFSVGIAVAPSTAFAQTKSVSLEILAYRTEVTEQQKWSQMLSEVGASRVRIKNSTRQGYPDISEEKLGSGTSIVLTGVLTRGSLVFPGGKFTIRDKAKIKDLVEKLRADGAKVTLTEKQAFGLTAEQLVGLHKDLSVKVESETRGREAREVITEIVSSISTPLIFADSVGKQFSDAEPVGDELVGLSAGTALAAIARPLGLVLAPRRERGKDVELLLLESDSVDEHWPIGWPLRRQRAQVAPAIFERIKRVEITNYVLGDTLLALEKKTKIPFLYDYNSMARKGIDMDETRVTLVKDKQTVASVVRQILNQSKPAMAMEIRSDERGSPFIWISPLGR